MNTSHFSAKVFEEEDFDPRDYNYVLTPDIANTKACFMLKEAEDELIKKSKGQNETGEIPEVSFSFSVLTYSLGIYRLMKNRCARIEYNSIPKTINDPNYYCYNADCIRPYKFESN